MILLKQFPLVSLFFTGVVVVIGFHKYSKLEGLSSKPTTRDSFLEADDITT